MPSFLLDLNYTLETTLLAAAISFVLAAGLIWLMMKMVCRSRLTQLRTTLEKEISASEQQRTQLATDLNHLQQKLQQTELNIAEQSAQIVHLEHAKQAAQTEAEQALALKSSITQQNNKLEELNKALEQEFQLDAVDVQSDADSTQSELAWHKHYQIINRLSQRLHEAEQVRTELQQEQQSRQGSWAEQEAAVSALTAAANQQAERAGQLEQALQDQQIQFTQQQQQWQNSLNEKDAALSTLTVIADERAERVGQLEQALQAQQIQLTQEQQQWQSRLAEKDAAIGALTAGVNEQAERAGQLEQSLQQHTQLTQQQQNLHSSLAEKDAAISALNTTINEQAERIGQLEQSLQEQHIPFNQDRQQQLDSAVLQVQELKRQLAEQESQTENALARQQPGMELQENYQALEKKLADSEAVIQELRSALAATPTEPVATAADLIKKIADQEALIAELNETVTGQANHLFRLEYDLEVKSAIIRDHDSPLEGIPAAIVAKQEEDQARIAELERALKPQQKTAQNTLEKTQEKPLELFNPAKQKIDEITDAAKHFPDQLKGFYQKLLSKSQ